VCANSHRLIIRRQYGNGGGTKHAKHRCYVAGLFALPLTAETQGTAMPVAGLPQDEADALREWCEETIGNGKSSSTLRDLVGTMSAAGKLQPIFETPQLLGGPCHGANGDARSAAKMEALNARSHLVSLAFYFLHVFDPRERHSHVEPLGRALCLTLGFYPAACVLTAITGAALIVSLWVNTDNE
jgi:hypothetical protein